MPYRRRTRRFKRRRVRAANAARHFRVTVERQRKRFSGRRTVENRSACPTADRFQCTPSTKRVRFRRVFGSPNRRKHRRHYGGAVKRHLSSGEREIRGVCTRFVAASALRQRIVERIKHRMDDASSDAPAYARFPNNKIRRENRSEQRETYFCNAPIDRTPSRWPRAYARKRPDVVDFIRGLNVHVG